jgi:DNA-binding NarL/FixJ family response regulator
MITSSRMTGQERRGESPGAAIPAAKVLVVDRHEGIRDALCANLSHHGLQVVAVAADGIEAIEKARILVPDIVILDFHMTRCGGLEAARVIRSEMPHIKIILLTMWGEEAYSRAAAECGAIACFPKDVATRELVSVMKSGTRREAESLADV